MNQHEIKTRREKLGLSVTALGRYIGTSHQYVSQLENGTRNAKDSKLSDINNVLTRLETVAQATANLVQIRPQTKKGIGGREKYSVRS